jgi:hypothetical protein
MRSYLGNRPVRKPDTFLQSTPTKRRRFQSRSHWSGDGKWKNTRENELGAATSACFFHQFLRALPPVPPPRRALAPISTGNTDIPHCSRCRIVIVVAHCQRSEPSIRAPPPFSGIFMAVLSWSLSSAVSKGSSHPLQLICARIDSISFSRTCKCPTIHRARSPPVPSAPSALCSTQKVAYSTLIAPVSQTRDGAVAAALRGRGR